MEGVDWSILGPKLLYQVSVLEGQLKQKDGHIADLFTSIRVKNEVVERNEKLVEKLSARVKELEWGG